MAETPNISDKNLADSIAMLEQILEVMPQDSDALKALYSANRKVGNDLQAFDYLSRIIEVYTGGERELLSFIQEELPKFESKYPSEVAAQTARLRVVAESEVHRSAASSSAVPEQSARKTGASNRDTDISEELALAWRLYEENQLSQEEYSSVLHDLTEVSSKELDVPISVLHVLNDRGFTQMNRILNHLSSRSGVPGISLSRFELAEEMAEAFPIEIAAHDGALPFSFMGNDLLVAVLNPFNHVLVDKVESESGHRCHTYLVEPEDYDAALERLRALYNKANPPSPPSQP